MLKKHNIEVLSVSIRGALHKAKDLPCQDYCCAKHTANKLVAVVSDGAGSARYSKTGAKLICETLCNLLIKSKYENIQQEVIKAIEITRQKLIIHRLNKTKNTAGLNNFAATVVGVFYHKGKGIFFHIGDGAGIAFKQNEYDTLIISEPENGAFSCETYFYTMDNWQEALRFTSFENADRIMLMTDGVTGFVFSDDFYKIRQNFLIPIVQYLENESQKKSAVRALENTLNDERAQHLNADDKTILWAKL